jgi:hypothetical protein
VATRPVLGGEPTRRDCPEAPGFLHSPKLPPQPCGHRMEKENILRMGRIRGRGLRDQNSPCHFAIQGNMTEARNTKWHIHPACPAPFALCAGGRDALPLDKNSVMYGSYRPRAMAPCAESRVRVRGDPTNLRALKRGAMAGGSVPLGIAGFSRGSRSPFSTGIQSKALANQAISNRDLLHAGL